MKLQEVTLYENRSHRILNEGWHDLTESQQKYQLRWERELFPLLEQYVKLAEAELTADQIQAIFKGAEANAMASGTNQTALGKAGSAAAKAGDAAVAGVKMTAELAKKVDAKINELGRLAQNAGPVKNADAKFEELKKKIASENSDSKIVQGIQKVSDWAKENPKKASLAVGILTAIAAFAGGPAGGAAAGLILRATKDLLQGEKLSTAIGKSVKTAAYGAMAGWLFNQLGDVIEGMRIDAVPFEKEGVTAIKFDIPQMNYSGTNMMGTTTSGSFGGQGTLWVTSSDTSWSPYLKDLIQGAKQGDIQAFSDLTDAAKVFDLSNAIQNANATNEFMKQMAVDNDAMLKIIQSTNDVISAMAQGSVTATKDGGAKVSPEDVESPDGKTGEDYNKEGDKKEESVDIEAEFNRYLAEIDGGAIDAAVDSKAGQAVGGALKKGFGALKKGASAAGGAIAKGAKAAGKELGNKATYNKMMSAWKKAGEPTDTGSIINILQGLGMSPEQIQSVGDEQGVELKAKNIGDPETPAAEPAAKTAQGKPADDSAAQGGDAAPADDSAPAADKKDTAKPKATKTVAKGDVVKGKDGKQYRWEGALYTDLDTGRTVGVQATVDMGLPHPKIDPVRDAIKAAGPDVMAMVLDQINSKGVKAGTKDAQVAKQAGAKGTQALPSAQAKQAKAGIAKPGTVAAKPKPTPTAARMAPAPTTIQ